MNKLIITLLAATVLPLGTIRLNATEITPLTCKLTITPEIKKAFSGSDSIEVREITGTAPRFQVDGTYRIVGTCHQETIKTAMLYVGNTAEAGTDAILAVDGSSLYKACPGGQTEFDITFRLLRPGTVHATIYDLDKKGNDNAQAGLYLGSVSIQP